MEFEKIISVPGLSGLYAIIAQMRNSGFIVEGLTDKRRIPVSSTQRIILLKDVSLYTIEGDMPLIEIFRKLSTQAEKVSSIDSKSDPATLKAAMKSLLPEYDEERVHVSDIRKLFLWFHLLNGKVSFEEKVADAEDSLKESDEASLSEEPAVVSAVSEEKETKKTTAKKKKSTEATDQGDAAPAPKKRTKKTDTTGA